MMAPLFVEVECAQKCKDGEEICGDAFLSRRIPEEERILAILSDGLGSGVKANILASMTATMAMKFMENHMEIVPSAETIMDTLPVCQVRKISYATFTIVDCAVNGVTRIIEQDNPPFFLIRDGEVLQPEAVVKTSERWQKRKIRLYTLETRPEDRIVVVSDGITQAGLGGERNKLGWRERGCRDYILRQIRKTPTLSARDLAQNVLAEGIRQQEHFRAEDDMSCAVLYFRKPRQTLVVSGPPFDHERDREVARMVDGFDGFRVICGGTTANIVARELGRNIRTDLNVRDRSLPPVSHIEGTDLVTEGILTLTRAAQLLEEDAPAVPNAAGRLVAALRESDVITFVVGTRINEAHQDPTLPVDLEIRRNIIKRIAALLRERYLKDVNIQYV